MDIHPGQYILSQSTQDVGSTQVSVTNKLFTCPKCKATFMEDSELKNHLQCCQTSTIRYKYEDNQAHKGVHSGGKPSPCPLLLCAPKFGLQSTLNTNLRTHSGESKVYQCHICKYKYRQKPGLEKHLRTHAGEKQFKCQFCNKRFKSKQILNDHIRMTHTLEKTYQCYLCNRGFSNKYYLGKHMNIHASQDICSQSTEKVDCTQVPIANDMFTCPICNTAFMYDFELEIHIQFCQTDAIESEPEYNPDEDDKFECQICFKTFPELDQLRRHDQDHLSVTKDYFVDFKEYQMHSEARTMVEKVTPLPEEVTIEENKLEFGEDRE